MIAQALGEIQVEQPNSIAGLVLLAAVQALVLAGQILHARLTHRRQKGLRSDVREIKDNTVNGHESNLRGDIDRLLELGEDNQRLGEANQTAVSELRGEVKGLTHRVDQITTPTTPIIKAQRGPGW